MSEIDNITTLYSVCAKILENKWISDIHITAGDPLRVRLSGRLEKCGSFPVVNEMMIREFLSKLNKELKDPKTAIEHAEKMRGDGDARNGYDFCATIGDYHCRGNLSLANSGCLSIALRRHADSIPAFDSLGLPESVLEQIKRPTGMILVTGPTGSGKSTTLAAMLDFINRNYDKHILSIEDPVEYVLDPIRCKVTRKEIGTDAPSFISALRAAVRQDPDIIMVGEIRDLGTMRASLAAAETGHLVLATMHTNSAAKTVDRVGTFFPADEKTWAYAVFSSVVNCIVSQTLVPHKEASRGRILAGEVLIGTSAMRTLIKEVKINQIINAIEQGANDGHQSLSRHLAKLVENNDITSDSAFSHAHDPERLKQYVN